MKAKIGDTGNFKPVMPVTKNARIEQEKSNMFDGLDSISGVSSNLSDKRKYTVKKKYKKKSPLIVVNDSFLYKEDGEVRNHESNKELLGETTSKTRKLKRQRTKKKEIISVQQAFSSDISSEFNQIRTPI